MWTAKKTEPSHKCGTREYAAPELFYKDDIKDFVAVDFFAVVKTILAIVCVSISDTNVNRNKQNPIYAKTLEVVNEISIKGRINKYNELSQIIGASRPPTLMPFRPCYEADVHLSDDDVMSESPKESVMSESPNESGGEEAPLKRPRY